MKSLLTEWCSFNVDSNLVNEAIKENGGRLIVSGVMQRANAKNQNGRVYKKSLLEREIDRYKKNEVAQRRALGELDHADCMRPSAEILCESGWKMLKDVSEDEKVYTLNLNTKQIELQQITKKIYEPYNNKMVRLKGKNIDTLVTPNHRFLLVDRYGNESFVTAIEIFNNRTKYDKSYIPKHGFNGTNIEDNEYVTIKGVDESSFSYNMKKDLKEKYSRDLKIPAKTWYSFLGVYLAEGCTDKDSNRINVVQVKPNGISEIEKIYNGFPSEISWKKYDKPNSNGGVVFSFSDMRISNVLKPLGLAENKYIPTEYKHDGVNNLSELYEGFMTGDGTRYMDRTYKMENASTTSPTLADDLQEVMLKIGMGSCRVEQVNKDSIINGRKITAKYSIHRVKKAKSKGIYLDQRFLQMDLVDYNDYIACVSVPNETIYVRDNGKPFWSGNSSTVNLKNVSHNILECWWDGDDLYGKIEILNTPAGNILKELFKSGITVGISSRGMGSVKPISEGDAMEVQNDFELVTFDFVSNPSTHGAFMSPVKESVDKTIYYENAHKLAHDILCEIAGVCCIKGV